MEQLRGALLEGQFVLSGRLPTEQELCETLDVSRSTIREALRVLEAEGLIEVRRGSVAYVASKLDSLAKRGEILKWLAQRAESVIQILDVREGSEWLTPSWATTNRAEEFTSELRDLIAAQWAESDRIKDTKDVAKIAELDVAFYTAISSISGNEIANEIILHILPSFSEANKALLWVGKGIKQYFEEREGVYNFLMAILSRWKRVTISIWHLTAHRPYTPLDGMDRAIFFIRMLIKTILGISKASYCASCSPP